MGEKEYFKEGSLEEESFEGKSSKEEYFAERRKGPDKWIRAMKTFAMICWALFVFSFYLVSKAQPQLESFFERWLNVKVREGWDEKMLFYTFILMLVIFYFSCFGLIINTRRHKRKTDKYSPALIFLLITSMIGVVVYVFNL